MRIIGAAGLVLLSFHMAASAQEPAKEKLVCKRITQADTGSHFSSSRRICKTKEEWKELEDEAQRLLQSNRSSTAAGIGGSVGGSPH